MITLFEVDKSGSEVFEKDYSIAVVKNNEEVYGINLPQSLKDNLLSLFNKKELQMNSPSPKKDKFRFRIRTHTAMIILLIEKALRDEGGADKLRIEICNDIDGHFNEIKDMVYKNISKLVPSLKLEDIVQTKFPKTSLVDSAARNLRERNIKETQNYIIPKIDLNDLIKLIKK